VKFVAPLRSAAAKLAAAVAARELALLIGLALLAGGAAQIYPPAAYLVPGAILVYVAIKGIA